MDCKRSSSPTSAATIGGNEDILIEILLILPAKSLIRFQCVSKQWRSLILSQRFSHLHTLHHCRRCKPLPSFLLRSSITSEFFVCHPNGKKLVLYRFKFCYQKVLQSCNGLLLLECRSSPNGKKDYYICNPTTRKYRKLVLRDDTVEHLRGLCIVFDPTKSPYYKVFCFRGNDRRFSEWVEEYDSETRRWTDRVKISGRLRLTINRVYMNDAMYFIRPHGTSYCFSFEDKLYRVNEINETPAARPTAANKWQVMESNEHLHCVLLSLHPVTNGVYVFERSKEGCDWFLKYEVNLEVISATLSGLKSISLLGMISGKRDRDSALLFHMPGKIIVYRFVEEIFEVLVDLTEEDYVKEGQLQFLFKNAHQFIQTLASV